MDKKMPFTYYAVIVNDGNGNTGVLAKSRYLNYYSFVNGKNRIKQLLSVGERPWDEMMDMLIELKVKVVVARRFLPRELAALKEKGILCFTFEGGTDAAFQALIGGGLQEL
ncbi:MAG: hypothetical protein LKG56_01245 [Lachnospiraceae bacterium]|jgi:predicted Fe-Mo cluster-binding NifX family protein|nr:hypothetical protein [Lachnospiraceae bacterium]MCH4030758.1 hypothetical protein [Lachnospiraceae bacterium]MCH4070730.1 hypothetical protein [Lachnospiraceae bacterium]MCH4107094.1 hypothetical protein [Lachnospiraceae bacterium]MCI1302050.1 hypothetical protein [Lachnospiraceae bacterium]